MRSVFSDEKKLSIAALWIWRWEIDPARHGTPTETRPPVLRDEYELHVTSFAKKAAAILTRRRNTICARCVCLCLEQAEETAGIGWGIVMTRYVSHGTFTEGHAEGGICR